MKEKFKKENIVTDKNILVYFKTDETNKLKVDNEFMFYVLSKK